MQRVQDSRCPVSGWCRYVPQIGIAVRHLKINRDKFISVTKHEIELPSPNEEDSRKLLWAANVASTGVGSIFQRTPR